MLVVFVSDLINLSLRFLFLFKICCALRNGLVVSVASSSFKKKYFCLENVNFNCDITKNDVCYRVVKSKISIHCS